MFVISVGIQVVEEEMGLVVSMVDTSDDPG